MSAVRDSAPQDPKDHVKHWENGRDHIVVRKMVCEQNRFCEVLQEALTIVTYRRVVVVGCRSGRHRSPTVGTVAAHWVDTLLGSVHLVHLGLTPETEWLEQLKHLVEELQKFPEDDHVTEQEMMSWPIIHVPSVHPFDILDYKGCAYNTVMCVWENFLQIIPSKIFSWYMENLEQAQLKVPQPPWKVPMQSGSVMTAPPPDDSGMHSMEGKSFWFNASVGKYVASPRTPTSSPKTHAEAMIPPGTAASSSGSHSSTSQETSIVWPPEIEDILVENNIDSATRRNLALLKNSGDAGMAHAIRIIFNLNRKSYHLGNPSAFVSRCVENVFLHEFDSLHR